MQAKLIEWLSKYLLIPLIMKGIQWIKDWTSEFFRKRKLKKENDKKVENYEESTTIDESRDTFRDLP